MRWPVIAAGLCCAITAGACAPPRTHVDVDTTGARDFLLLTLDARDDALIFARRFDPAREAFELEADGERRVVVLGYPRPLEEYGVSERALRAEGRPLPPPVRWLEVSATGEATARDVGAWTADALPTVRVPSLLCPTLEVVPGTQRIIGPTERVTFAAALDATHTLLGLRGRLDASRQVSLAVATPTSVRTLPIPLAWSPPRGFVEADGAVWVVATATRSGDPRLSPLICRFGADQPLDARACATHPSDRELRIEHVAGRRTSGGALLIAATTVDAELVTWRSDDPVWRFQYASGPGTSNCRNPPTSAVLTLDGDDTGVASFRDGALERFRLSRDRVERQPIFERPDGGGLCEATYGRHPSGLELLVERDASGGITAPRARAWWRPGEGAAWSPLEVETPLATGVAVPLDDLMVVTARSFTVLGMAVDPRRPDLPPQACESYPVSSDGTVAVVQGDTALVAGSAGDVVNDHVVIGLRRRGAAP